MPPASPFGRDFLSRDWPFLLACCSPAPEPSLLGNHADGAGDAESLLVLAEAHGVALQLAVGLQRSSAFAQFTRTFCDRLKDFHRKQLLSTLALTAELFRVLELLDHAGVEAAVVKGPVLSVRAFGDPAARQYGDIDFLLRHADISLASDALIAAGYEARISASSIRAGKTPGQYLFRRRESGAVLELHTERTLRYFPRPVPIDEFFRRKTVVTFDEHCVPALAAEDEFVLISIHGAKHFWERLMWISDVAAVVHRHRELNWDRVRQSASHVGAERMVRIALLLAERLLRVPVPEAMKREVADDTACLPMVRKIESWLPYAGFDPPPLVQRALFRFRMRGHLLGGARYLTRLSLSTTEEDWAGNPESAAASLGERLRRPFRLARKYRRRSRD